MDFFDSHRVQLLGVVVLLLEAGPPRERLVGRRLLVHVHADSLRDELVAICSKQRLLFVANQGRVVLLTGLLRGLEICDAFLVFLEERVGVLLQLFVLAKLLFDPLGDACPRAEAAENL